MVEANIYTDIANKKDGIFLSMLGIPDAVFSVDTVKNLLHDNPTEQEFKFNIHCDGGSVSEGLAIYDLLRNSGKTIYTNIDGSCHSMAVTLLLAAPAPNRTANRNSRALIHQVYGSTEGYANADQLRSLADDIEREQNAILDIYTQRTGTPRATLEQLMKQEKQRTAEELLQYGFISKINTYTTNKKQNTMNKKTKKPNDLLNKADRFLYGIRNLLAGAVNFDFTDADGNVVFSTDKDDDTLAVGDPVIIPDGTTEGTFTLQDGRTIVVAEGVITDIQDPATQTENAQLRDAVNQLTNSLAQAQNLITELRNQVKSTYSVAPRAKIPGRTNTQKTVETLKNEAREKRAKINGGKK